MPFGGKSTIATLASSTSRSSMIAPRSMSRDATTMVVVVGSCEAAVPPLPLPFDVTRMSTNAMSARKIPISRTNRFERFN